MSRSDRKEWYFEKTTKLFLDSNCTPLETSYKPAKVKWKFICECGTLDEILPDDIKRGRRCYVCTHQRRSESRRTSESEVREYFEGRPEKLISVEFKAVEGEGASRGRTFCKYTCKRGHVVEREFFKYRAGTICAECSPIDAAERYKFTLEEVAEIFKDHKCELLSKEYINYDQKLKYKCSCGNIAYSYVSAIKKGIKCGCQRLRGEDNPNWNPELTDEERLNHRNYPEYRLWVS